MQSILARQLRGTPVRRQLFTPRLRFSTLPARLAPDAANGAKPKKHHRVRNLLISSTVLLVGTYGAGVYYSVKNDEFYDKFTLYVPLAQYVVGFVDDWLFWLAVQAPDGDYKATWGDKHKPIKTVNVDGDSKANPFKYTVDSAKHAAKDAQDTASAAAKDVQKKSEKAVSAGSSKVAQAAEGAKSKAAEATETAKDAAKSVGERATVVPAKASSASGDIIHQPSPAKVQQLTGSSKGKAVAAEEIDPLLQTVVRQVNLAEQAQAQDILTDSYFETLAKAIKEASVGIKHEREVLIAESEAKAKKQVASTRDVAEQEYLAAKLNLVDSYNRRLQLALDAVTQKAVAAANNKIAAQYVELQRVFEHEISDRVEHERDGRLSQLSELKKDVATLQEAMLSSGRILESEDGVVSFYLALGDLQRVLASGKTVPLKPFLETLTKSLPSDPLVAAVTSSISPTVRQYGVLSHTQLAARFALIEPEIRRASLVQPDAGIAGHLGSMAASQLLVKKQGLPEGNDVESVLARTNTYLQQGDILQALAEANSLQGWSKKIASDWLAEARRRSEIEFLLTVLSEEGRLWSISRTKN